MSFGLSGEEAFSYGFGGKGKISEDCKFNDYGAPFQLNDVVGVYMVRHSNWQDSQNDILI